MSDRVTTPAVGDNPWLQRGPRPVRVVEVPRAGDGVQLYSQDYIPADPTTSSILFIHENRGIDAYVRDVAAGLASHGHRVVVPDLLTRLGGTARFERQDAEPPSPREIEHATHLADLGAVLDGLQREGPVVVVGFCFGGELGWQLASRVPSITGLATFYGVGPSVEEAGRLTMPVLAVYADQDDRVNDGVPTLLAALDEVDTALSLHRFGGTLHAFHNHRRPERYHPRAARQAWDLTTAWLDEVVAA